MRDASAPYEAKDTDWIERHLLRSRFTLTATYTVILVVLLAFSLFSTRFVFEQRLDRRLRAAPGHERVVLPQGLRLAEVREELFQTLLWVNLSLVVGAALVSSFVARMTFRPIQEAYQRERRFVADASHELRTPLTILRLAAEEGQRAEHLLEAQQSFATVTREVASLERLANELSHLSRADGTRSSKHSVYDPTTVAETVVTRFQTLAQAKGLRLEIKVPNVPKNPVSLHLSQEVFERVLLQLMQNACDYTPSGGHVFVEVSFGRTDLRVTVEDSGIGMSPAEQSFAGERFYRGDRAVQMRRDGSGLGLAYVYQVTAAALGSVELKSAVGQGTHITVHLPFFTISSSSS